MNNINSEEIHDLNRRKFIKKGLNAAGGAALLTIPAVNVLAAKKEYTVQQIIELVLKEIPGAPLKQTVDTLKSGTGAARVTGIATTMFETVEVVRKVVAMKANFIIVHEPTFYNHTDDVNWTGENNIIKQKQELLKQEGITVWRFHDYWHACRPDGITYGVLKKADWVQYNNKAEKVFTMPPSPLKQIAEHLKRSLGIEQVRVAGDLNASCEKIVLLPGAWGGQNQIATVEKEKPDLVIVGEVHEWETAEYIRDARALGAKTSLIVLGHSVSEEPGMEWLAEWLQPKLEGLKVTHIASHNPLMFV